MTTLASVSTSSAAPTYGNAQIQRSQLVRRHHDADGDDDGPKAERREGPGRRNPLVAAMMSALSSLVPASGSTPTSGTPATTPASAAPATPTAPATTPIPTTTETTSTPSDPATTLREAAYAFAHALYSALRGNDDGERRGHGHGHHHHHGHRSGGYGDLAERLSALATKLEAASGTPTPTTPTEPATSMPPSDTASTTPPAANPAPVVETPVSVAEPASAGAGNIHITINLNIAIGTLPATPPAPSTSNPLVDAFKKLLTALGADSGSSASPTERLTAFLRQMAESLSGDKSTTPATPSSGSLLNVSA